MLNFKGIHKEEIELRKNLVLNLTIEPLVLGKNNVAKLVVLNDITKDKQDEVLKNEFISMTAHQLKTPLSNTRLALKMMIAGDFGKISKKQKEILEKTYKNNDSLIYLVQDLIQDVKNSENSQFNDKSYVDLPSLTDSVVELYSEIIKAKKIKFKLAKVNGKLPKVSANSERIKMVIQNLLDNAIKYTPENGNIEISIKPKKTEVEFKIKDSGIGIPEEQKERIFTRFLRGINTTGATGSGLGLAIAKDIIKKSHGKIWFLSKENEGSTFFFSLPTMGN